VNRSTVIASITSAATMSVLAGMLYIVDCRRAGGDVERCWLTGLPFMGLGGASAGAFKLGYDTLNPKLRSRRPGDPDA
jgi:hypothetical protein